MKTPIHHILFVCLSVMVLISCGEDNDQPSTQYNSGNTEINEPITWRATDNVLIDCILVVNSTVTIEPGCTVMFTENGYLKVGQTKNGAIIANGTAEKPIRFTYKPNNLASVIQSGVWYGINFGERNLVNTTKLSHCIFVGAGKGNTPCIELYKTTLDMTSCTISNCAGIGIKATGAFSGFTTFSNNNLSACGSYLLEGTVEALSSLDGTNTFTPTNNQGIALLGGNVTHDYTLTKQTQPYTVLGSIFVDNAELTIESGCTLNFANRTSLNIGRDYPASLVAVGTTTEPILFTSSSTNPQPGDWQGLVFYGNNSSSLTIIKNAIIDYAGQPVNSVEGAILTYTPLRMENTTIRNSYTNGIYCGQGVSLNSFTKNTIQGCHKYPINIDIKQTQSIDSTITITNNSGMYNFINVRGTEITDNVRWKKQSIPYLLQDNLVIESSSEASPARLTLAPGCKLALTSSIVVGTNGCLYAKGTARDSIVFTSANENPLPGDWTSIDFTNTCSHDNNLSYCVVEYGGYFCDYQLGINSSRISITNSSIRNSLLHGIYLYYNNPAHTPYLNNNSFSGNPGSNIHYEPAS